MTMRSSYRDWVAGAAMAVLAVSGASPTAMSQGPYAPDGPVVMQPLPEARMPSEPASPPMTREGAGIEAPGRTVEPGRPATSPGEIEKLIEAAPAPALQPSSPAQGEHVAAPTFRGGALSPKITWRVENPFRLFTDPADTEVHRATFAALSTTERRNPVLAAERALAARHREGWAASMVDQTCWDHRNNKHQCDNRPDYLSPQSHAVIVTLDGVADASAIECAWSSVPHGDTSVASSSVLQPCDQPLRIEAPYPDGTQVRVSVGGVELQRTEVKVVDVFIVGMGDSFASGEGNPDIPVRFSRERDATYGDVKNKEASASGFPAREGTWRQIGDKGFVKGNARWLDQACHRSLYSQQLRAALQLAIEEPHRAVTYIGLACSGAEITDGLFLRYKGNEWVPNPPELSQISAAAVAQCDRAPAEPQDLPEAYHIKGSVPELGGLVLYKCPIERSRKIDLLLLSIGGNDIGFARLLANAILSDQSTLRKLGGWIGQVHGQSQASGLIDTLDERYKALNRALHNILHIPWEESDRILLTGYPGLALLGDGSTVCPDGRAGMDVVADFNLSTAKAREGVWVSDKLNRIMKASAGKHGWTFVDHHRRAFVDRGICAGFTDNAFSIADDLRIPRKVDGKWVPYNPADYPPYASRQRWFRTPNDAFMTGNFHVSESLLQKALKLKSLSFFQLVLAATYSGAFHPTAEGHASIADALSEQARAVLEKYGQGGTAPGRGGLRVSR